MKNSLNRFVPEGFYPFSGVNQKKVQNKKIDEILSNQKDKLVDNMSTLFDLLKVKNGQTLSFHHHLRNGDYVMNMVLDEIKKRDLKDMTLAPSSIFPIHEPMVELIKNQNVTKIYTNYLNGPVAKTISEGYLKDLIIMDTHGGRPRAIETNELVIDIAFIALPTSDKNGNGNGVEGLSACGTLGYAISDMMYAKKKVVITDHLVNQVDRIDIESKYIDYVLKVDKIGLSEGIVSGTTKVSIDPVQKKIAKDTLRILDELGLIKNGLTFQTGAGGTSLLVAEELKNKMLELKVKGKFASGGITSYLVEMQELGLFEKLYDVQCFDLKAVSSYKNNPNHLKMSASEYGNPNEDHPIVNNLDVVILGATEIDVNFNTNVTTDSNGLIIGGSGGHSDTAYGAKLTVITTNLIKSRQSIVKDEVRTVTTPGDSIDILVTERGIAINPKRIDLIEKLKSSKLNIKKIEDLYKEAIKITGIPKKIEQSNQVIGVVRYRDGSIIDTLYKMK
jgi:citrate lyase subunit alpha / citrate CoA-transferase